MAENESLMLRCEMCGKPVIFIKDSKYIDFMTIIERMRKDGEICLKGTETFTRTYNSWHGYQDILSYANKDRESEKSCDFYRKHISIMCGIFVKKSKSSNAKVVKDIPHKQIWPGDGDREVTIKYNYHDTYTFYDCFKRHEKIHGHAYFRPMSDKNSYTCPVCRSKHFYEICVNDMLLCPIVDSIKQKERINEQVDSFIKTIDNRDISAIVPKNITNSDDVVMFLNHLIKIEKGIRTTREHLCNLERTFVEAKRNTYVHAATGREELEEKYNEKIEIITQRVKSLPKKYAPTKSVYQSRGIFEPAKLSEAPKFTMELPTEPVPIKAGLFNRKKVALQNEDNMRAYQNKLQEYTAAKEQHEKQVRAYADVIKAYREETKKYEQLCRQVDIELDKKCQEEREQLYLEKDRILKQKEQSISNFEEQKKRTPAVTFVTKEIEETKALLQNLVEARTKLSYSGMIHPKYLDLAAISTIAEYFETGRVETLAGPSGAYNLYESELRANIIIAKLDTIIDSLEQIKQNQFKLYCVLSSIQDGIDNMSGLLQTANESLANISTQNKQIIENTAVTAYYSAKTAHYAKLNAELTDALGFMVALS